MKLSKMLRDIHYSTMNNFVERLDKKLVSWSLYFLPVMRKKLLISAHCGASVVKIHLKDNLIDSLFNYEEYLNLSENNKDLIKVRIKKFLEECIEDSLLELKVDDNLSITIDFSKAVL